MSKCEGVPLGATNIFFVVGMCHGGSVGHVWCILILNGSLVHSIILICVYIPLFLFALHVKCCLIRSGIEHIYFKSLIFFASIPTSCTSSRRRYMYRRLSLFLLIFLTQRAFATKGLYDCTKNNSTYYTSSPLQQRY